MAITSVQHIRLRMPEPEDVDFLYQLENDVEVWAFGNTHLPFSKEVLRQYCASAHDIYAERQVRFMLVHENDTVGAIDLFDFDPLHQRASVGVIVEQDRRGAGYASAALTELQKYAYEQLGLYQLHCHIPANNTASIRLFEKHHFHQTGVLKNWLRHADKNWLDVYVYQCFLPVNGQKKEEK